MYLDDESLLLKKSIKICLKKHFYRDDDKFTAFVLQLCVSLYLFFSVKKMLGDLFVLL